ncbi:hypothetical protein AcW2_006938 [Taiwanofungus camphoratus]|nr:hypothetical protein AcW2_006938 [Antrodia cinnamomea]
MSSSASQTRTNSKVAKQARPGLAGAQGYGRLLRIPQSGPSAARGQAARPSRRTSETAARVHRRIRIRGLERLRASASHRFSRAARAQTVCRCRSSAMGAGGQVAFAGPPLGREGH